MRGFSEVVLLLLMYATSFVDAQFGGGFFEQFMGGQQQQQQHHQPQNAPSDSNLYQSRYAETYCNDYICPRTLACVAFPHHCPCAYPAVEDKFELSDGSAICISKGGFKEGEAARKVDLARKGLL